VELAIEEELELDFATVPSEQLGKAIRIADAVTRYAEFCKSTVSEDFNLRGIKIVLDCANGATYQVAPKVFSELGAVVITLGDKPDGFNINRDVGSTHPQSLQRAVIEQGADIGIAFDGDGDRLQLVDRHGKLADGDDILYVLANAWHAQGLLLGPVVGTLMSNYGLQLALAKLDVKLIRANVGDRYVLQQLKEHGGNLGGETSGHILCLDRATTGDGIVSALQVLVALKQQGKNLREALQPLSKVPQKTVNVRLGDVSAKATVQAESVQAALTEAQQAVSGRGRAFLRPSGTEPVVRVTVEADDATLMQDTLDRLSAAVRTAAAA
jgi:phosphoglucosamine mutase